MRVECTSLAHVDQMTRAIKQDERAVRILDIITSVGIIIAGASLFYSTALPFLAVTLVSGWIAAVSLVVSVAMIHFLRERKEGLPREKVMDIVGKTVIEMLDQGRVDCQKINRALPFEPVIEQREEMLYLCINGMSNLTILQVLLKAYQKGMAIKVYLDERHLHGDYREVAVSKERKVQKEEEALNVYFSQLAKDFKGRLGVVTTKGQEALKRLQLARKGNPREKIDFCIII